MNNGKQIGIDEFLNNLTALPPEDRSLYQRIAGYNLGRIRNQDFPNKLSAMAATLQENHFRDTLNPKDLERQLRRWISNGLPLENIEPISLALKISPSELLYTAPLFPGHSTFIVPSLKNDTPCERLSNLSGGGQQFHENGARHETSRRRRKYVHRVGTVGLILLVILVVFMGIGNFGQKAVTISWPNIVDTHSEYVSGKLLHFNGDHQDISVKLFVKPMDGDTKYWLNAPDYPTVITEYGEWYMKCRFGDEDIRSMKKAPPLRFELFAVALKTGVELPLDSTRSYFEAGSEKEFLDLIEPYAIAVSDKFSLVRVESAEPEIPIVLAISPSVKITWGENVPMYLEIYHGGQVLKEGYFSSGDSHDLPSSQIPYEIKMSRKKGFHQSNTWILVENE